MNMKTENYTMRFLSLISAVVIGFSPQTSIAGSEIHPFKVEIANDAIEDLQARLHRARWPHQLPNTTWEHGADSATLREITEYWKDEYDWRSAEAVLNTKPQFLTKIDGSQLHFVHSKSEREEARPLILLHGWPGSFYELFDLAEPLNHPKDDAPAFHTVIPSLPGFGFSGPTSEADWDPKRMAKAMLELMDRLGYDQFYAHGTDFGSVVAQWMARIAPERVVGLHSNFILSAPPSPEAFQSMSVEELDAFTSFQKTEMGYFTLQETKPQTIAFALNDSPVGLLAWHAEKFQSWVDHDGSFMSVVDIDTFLTNLSIYWFTETSGSSARIYRAGFLAGGNFAPQPKFDTPIGHAIFPHEVIVSPERWNEETYNIVYRSQFERGGHFPALEQPNAIIEDIRAFVSFLEVSE